MQTRLLVTVSVLTLLIVLAGGLWMMATSLWFMWELLPAAEQNRIALEMTTVQRSGVGGAVSAALPEFTRRWEGEVHGLAWSGEPTPMIIVLRPHLFAQRRVAAEARLAGWPVTRRGLVLVLTQPERSTPVPSFATLFLDMVTKRWLQIGWPLQPVALWAHTNQSDSDPLPEGLLMVTSRGGRAQALWVTNEEQLRHLPVVVQQPVLGGGVELTNIPDVGTFMTEGWNKEVVSALRFVRTAPDIMAALHQHSGRRVVIQEQAAAVQVTGNPVAFAQLARTWVQDEERYGRLVTRPFRLPDATFGHERIPGQVEEVFTLESGDECAAPIPEKTTLWLCQRGQTAVLATSETLGRALLDRPLAQTRLAVEGPWLTRLLERWCPEGEECRLNDIYVSGTDRKATAQMQW